MLNQKLSIYCESLFGFNIWEIYLILKVFYNSLILLLINYILNKYEDNNTNVLSYFNRSFKICLTLKKE